MPDLNGLHVYSFLPAHARGVASPGIDPAVGCTLVLGALQWRRLHGPMRLYADREFATLIHELRLEWLYDGGIDTEVLASMPDTIRYDTFWMAPKIFAYGAARLPAAFLDVDLVVWRQIPDWQAYGLTVLHPEFNGRGGATVKCCG
jgi:hypothetical protein